MLFKDYIE